MAVVLSVAGADAEMVGGRSALGQVALESIDVLAEGARLRGSVQEVVVDDEGTVHARLIYRRPSGDRMVVRSRIPGQLGAGHRELATVRAEDGSPIVEQMLDAKANEIDVVGQSTRTSNLTSARYEYLVVLAGLIVVARRWRRLLVASRTDSRRILSFRVFCGSYYRFGLSSVSWRTQIPRAVSSVLGSGAPNSSFSLRRGVPTGAFPRRPTPRNSAARSVESG